MHGNMTTRKNIFFSVALLAICGCSTAPVTPVITPTVTPAKTNTVNIQAIMPPAVKFNGKVIPVATAPPTNINVDLSRLYKSLPVGRQIVLERSTNLLEWLPFSTNWWFGVTGGTMDLTARGNVEFFRAIAL